MRLVVRMLAVLACGLLLWALAQGQGRLVYNSYMSDPLARAFDQKVVALFKQKYPGIQVTHTIVAHEDFKQAIRTYLISNRPPDVLTWFAGERMRYFAERGLVADITDLWRKEGWEKVFPKGFQALSKTGDRYTFLPTSYYWWAVYYRKDLFQRLGLAVPKTWKEFVAVCDRLNAAGLTPIAIGTKFLWPAAGWFDYLNLRVNGPQFHLALMDGKVAYTDPRVRRVFDYWKELLDHKCFLENPASYDHQDAANLMVQGKAAMYLIGDFIRDQYPDDREEKELDFFRFPVIDPKVPLAEEAPTDGYFIPAKAPNMENAKLFLSFLASKEVMELAVKEYKRLVPRNDVDPKLYPAYIQKGLKEIIEPAAYITQFYDRDTDPEMANKGMNGFVQFMANPGRIDAILKSLEEERARIFKDNR
ncbi:ABC transporter substrate-binding protein [Thermus sp. NEB1569]|uniref:ABC transporter substrate-binding protein n=1 Tax=Thermus sp. NEB1569 TaxID=2918899 RepID=UPI001EFB4F4D|nr:ABC transporter substrate-binding protein [Thermus sp. NEB1569]ULR40232.1 ABC transporter substrate-binding protein [Thermus sp. NEB1569]